MKSCSIAKAINPIIPLGVKPLDVPIIIPLSSIGYNCRLSSVCLFAPDSVNINTTFQVLGEATYQQDNEGINCALNNNHTLYWNNNGTWQKITSLTDVKLMSGVNPVSNYGMSPEFGCDDQHLPATFNLQAKTVLDCQTIVIYDSVVNKGGGSATMTINIDVDSGNCVQNPLVYKDTQVPLTFANSSSTPSGYMYLDTTLTFLFLSAIIILLTINIFKGNKRLWK